MPEERSQPGLDSIDADQVVWASSDHAVRILATKQLLEEIRSAAYRARFGSRRAGVEIGGVLYGRRLLSGVELCGWASIDCGWSYGPSFTLTSREQGTLACLLDGLKEELRAQEFEILGWFVSRIRGDRVPAVFDSELHQRFFSTPGSLLCILQARREGDVWMAVHVYESENRRLIPCEPFLVIDPALVPAGGPRTASRAAMVRQGAASSSQDDDRERIEDSAIQSLHSLSESVASPPADVGALRAAENAAEDARPGSNWDSVPRGVWSLLALLIILTIGGAAWLWLFQSDVVRPILLRWTSSASVPPRSFFLTARVDRDRLSVQWDGRSQAFLNPVSAKLVFEFATNGPTTVPLRPEEAQRGYFTTLTSLSPTRVTMIVTPAPGHEFSQTFFFPAPENRPPEPAGAAPASGPLKPAPRN
jgi:hypothetical protein